MSTKPVSDWTAADFAAHVATTRKYERTLNGLIKLGHLERSPLVIEADRLVKKYRAEIDQYLDWHQIAPNTD